MKYDLKEHTYRKEINHQLTAASIERDRVKDSVFAGDNVTRVGTLLSV